MLHCYRDECTSKDSPLDLPGWDASPLYTASISQVLDKPFLNCVRSFLTEYPQIPFEETEDQILVRAATPEGFDVFLVDHGESCTVHFNLWHEEFEDPEDAAKCFRFGLGERCRLIETRRGDCAYKWNVLYFDDGEWHEVGVTGLLIFPFWSRR